MAVAIQLPSAAWGANTCTKPTSVLPAPATTRPMHNARNAGSPKPARCAEAATATASAAARTVPVADSEREHGTDAKDDAASALDAINARAESNASAG